MALRLRPLRADDEDAVRAAQVALEIEGFTFAPGLRADMSWSEYLDLVDVLDRGDELPVDRLPTTYLVADVDGEIVGRTSIRRELDAFHASHGGHIGYCVVPAHRRRGYATEMLRQSLVIARAAMVERVLVTCDADNAASAAVIERSGGVFESIVDGVNGGKPKRRFWFD